MTRSAFANDIPRKPIRKGNLTSNDAGQSTLANARCINLEEAMSLTPRVPIKERNNFRTHELQHKQIQFRTQIQIIVEVSPQIHPLINEIYTYKKYSILCIGRKI